MEDSTLRQFDARFGFDDDRTFFQTRNPSVRLVTRRGTAFCVGLGRDAQISPRGWWGSCGHLGGKASACISCSVDVGDQVTSLSARKIQLLLCIG